MYRTLSDESVCSNRRGSSFASSRSSILDQALPNDILFSTTPPYHSTLPPRTHPAPSMGSLRSKWRPGHPGCLGGHMGHLWVHVLFKLNIPSAHVESGVNCLALFSLSFNSFSNSKSARWFTLDIIIKSCFYFPSEGSDV